MSNILIIKHGSLGDIVQICGVIKDISKAHINDKVYLLTTPTYVELLSKCPYIDGVMIDKRLPRWNVFYLLKLKKLINKQNFIKVYDLQNSSRTNFYRKFIFNVKDWSSTRTLLKKSKEKKIFNKEPVLKRFEFQLNKSGIKTNYTLKPDFSWAAESVDTIVNQYISSKFILFFPWCSPNLPQKSGRILKS